MASWTIGGSTLATLGIDAAEAQYFNGDTDRLFLRLEDEDFESAPDWDYGDSIVLKKDGSEWFQGVVKASANFGEVSREGWDYEIHGPWEFLERNQYLQQREHVAGSLPAVSAYSSECLLGLDSSDTRQTIMETVEDVIDYAIARGANLAKGTIASGIIKYVTTAKDMTIAEVLRQLLRWEPDITIQIDHSTTPKPTIHMKRRGAATTVSYDSTGGSPVSKVKVKSRPDLQLPGVVIYWNKISSVDGVDYPQISVDSYLPGAATELTDGVAHFTMDLEGSESTSQKSPIVTETLPTSGTINTKKTWAKKHLPWLVDLDDGDITLSDYTATVAKALQGASTTASDYPRELISGTVFDWMSGIKACQMVCKFTVTFTGTITDAERKLFGPDMEREVAVMVTGTDATSKTYKGFGSFTPGESVPSGYAEAYYESLATLQYEATLDLEDEECDGAARPGKVLNLSGGLSGWGTMRSIIYSVSEELTTGRTHIEAGPQARVLGPEDFQQLARANRANGYRWKLGRSGAGLSGDSISGPVATPLSNDVTPPRDALVSHPFRIYSDGTLIYVEDGYVQDLIPTISASYASGADRVFVIKVVMEATTEDTSNPYSLDGATFSSATVEVYNAGSVPSDTLPSINETTGAASDGTFYLPIGTEKNHVCANTGISRSIQVHFCPPDTIRHWPSG